MAIGKCDVAVVGGGIFGLATAHAAARRGMAVTLVDRGALAGAASGGIVGALSPHVPDAWNAKKEFQFQALLSARDFWTGVEGASGLPTGYRRDGRLIPILTPQGRAMAEARGDAAREHWRGAADWRVLPADAAPAWLSPLAAPCGVVHDTLAGSLFPRDACRALAVAARRAGVQVLEHWDVTHVAPGTISGPRGAIAATTIVVAAGVQGFDLLAPHVGPGAGTGVKGQAALLNAQPPTGLPTIFADGIYIIAHGPGSVAVGSTSEPRWDNPTATDALLDAVIATARALSPMLRDAPVTARWAALRPKARRRDPMLGPVPGAPGILAALGGFKIGFGIAHKVGDTLAAMIDGAATDLPDSFTVAHHMPDRP